MIALRAAALVLLALPVWAQPPGVTLSLPGAAPVTLTSDSLAALPVHEQEIAFTSSHGEERATYRGVLLWDIVAAHTGIEDDVKPALRRVLMVTARDGHQVAYSIGEIAPDFGNTPAMLAVQRDGQPMDAGLRVVVPGDRRGARNIRDVDRIELR